MKHTNINIISPKGQMKYFIEYFDDDAYVSSELLYKRDPETDRVNFYDRASTNIKRVGNEWYDDSYDVEMLDDNRPVLVGVTPLPAVFGEDCHPASYNISSLNLYFPRFSVETYEKGVKYALNISTYIHGREVMIGSFLVDRNDVLAAETIRMFANEEYYEYLSVKIVDPWYLTYGDDWKEFRQSVCGETVDEEGYEFNSTGSVLNITLHPVRNTSTMKHPITGEYVNVYTEIPGYSGGQNAINLGDTVSDYLQLRIADNRDVNNYYESRMLIRSEVIFNKVYYQNVDGLKEYIKETYQISKFDMKMEMVVQDDENIYKYHSTIIDNPWMDINIRELQNVDGDYVFLFDNWNGWHEGIYINMFLHIIPDGAEDDIIYLKSNRILVTQDLFKYLVGTATDLDKIYLEAIDMNIFNINAVNKVQQSVIHIDRPTDYKANIIKPVFFRVHEIGGVIIHPEVTEQICINLDQYKAKVNSFILRIEGVSFKEYARTTSGVIFKVVGTSLPGTVSSGKLYILNQDSEMITTGQYTYEK